MLKNKTLRYISRPCGFNQDEFLLCRPGFLLRLFFAVDFCNCYIGYFRIVNTFLAKINKDIMVRITIIIQELRFSLTCIFPYKDRIYDFALALQST